MNPVNTHSAIDNEICGTPIAVENDFCALRLITSEKMSADRFGLVHGGFIFGAADYCAMLAVNEPNVVLASADVRFISPVKVGDELIFEARISAEEAKKRTASVTGTVNGQVVFSGVFICFVPERHVLCS